MTAMMSVASAQNDTAAMINVPDTYVESVLGGAYDQCKVVVEHLRFKGVPINGPVEEFTKQLYSKGFVYNEHSSKRMQGYFAGYKDTSISVHTAEGTSLVCMVIARIPLPYDAPWDKCLQEYNSLKSMLTEKYGAPAECVEETKGSIINRKEELVYYEKLVSYPRGKKGRKVQSQLVPPRHEECKWMSVFKLPVGDIELVITNESKHDYRLELRYKDKASSALARNSREQAMSDL